MKKTFGHKQRLDFCEGDRIRLFGEADGHGATWHFPTYGDFDVTALQKAGIEHALLDLDGNLTPAYHHDKMTPETIAAIRAMKMGFRTVSVASNNEWDLSRLRRRFGFSHVFQPYQEGTDLPYKPDPEFYEHILAKLAVPPETVVMIGDDMRHDVAGAAAVGMQTVLVDRLDPYGFFGEASL